MILFIDTSDFNGVHFALIRPDGSIQQHSSQLAYNQSYKTAELLQKFLTKHKVKPKDLSRIIVCSGPGSFTGIRVGVALAQSFGFALGITVVAIKKSQVPKDLQKLSKVH